MLSLSIEQSLLACCLVLVVGRLLTNKVGVLSRYSIPDPIVGGFAVCHCRIFHYRLERVSACA